ncbi:MAG: 30S ribosomal protein S20 [Candidatus Pacebacteria bacterium]|nr:30S ribosomal protein S20 [Candidatus Paceibacterota bacterium]
MPNIKSSKKRLKQSEKRRVLNLRYRRKMKDTIKEIDTLVSNNKKKDAEKLLPKAYKAIDKAAKKNIIKENNASRKKARITKSITAKK